MLPSAGALINQSSGLHGAVAGANVVRASRHVSLLSACQSIDILVQYVTFFFLREAACSSEHTVFHESVLYIHLHVRTLLIGPEAPPPELPPSF